MFNKLKYQTKILIGLPIFIASIYLLIKNMKKNNDTIIDENNDVIFMSGLDYRKGDLNLNQQVELLKTNLKGKKIKGFKYNDISGVLDAVKESPNDIIILFSAGCSHSDEISEVTNNKANMFIVQPYGISSDVTKSVNQAVANGVPNKNVITGGSIGTGLNIVKNATPTPSNYNHWTSLKFVGTLIK
jgi:hypothetical protein